jgi:hypothetical protein
MSFFLYIGTDQHVHLLSPIGDEEQRRPLSVVAAAKLRRGAGSAKERLIAIYLIALKSTNDNRRIVFPACQALLLLDQTK